MNNIRLERLGQLRYMLENHDKIFKTVQWDMAVFYTEHYTNFCSTAACALGSAAVYPPFVKLGLDILGKPGKHSGNCLPRFGTLMGFMAGQAFFMITEEESFYLFDPEYFQTEYGENVNSREIRPKHVAKRVKKLMDHYIKKPNTPLFNDEADFLGEDLMMEVA